MKHYLVVLVPLAEGSWRAHFPDFPGCRAEGATVEAAVAASSAAVGRQIEGLREQRVSPPPPQTYEDVRSNGWGAARGIDWTKAVISLVSVRIPE